MEIIIWIINMMIFIPPSWHHHYDDNDDDGNGDGITIVGVHCVIVTTSRDWANVATTWESPSTPSISHFISSWPSSHHPCQALSDGPDVHFRSVFVQQALHLSGLLYLFWIVVFIIVAMFRFHRQSKIPAFRAGFLNFPLVFDLCIFLVIVKWWTHSYIMIL